MQGLFRNPLADPGLVGVSAGAALAAAATIVLGDRLFGAVSAQLPFAMLPIGAFFGGLASTLVLYAHRDAAGAAPRSRTMLLAGVALGAFTGALTGLLAFISDDRQLRDLTFWIARLARRRELDQDRHRRAAGPAGAPRRAAAGARARTRCCSARRKPSISASRSSA
ncbi:MAG: iron chelate uptake ABC transporter family permease subunit [Piscinibacter sp.]